MELYPKNADVSTDRSDFFLDDSIDWQECSREEEYVIVNSVDLDDLIFDKEDGLPSER